MCAACVEVPFSGSESIRTSAGRFLATPVHPADRDDDRAARSGPAKRGRWHGPRSSRRNNPSIVSATPRGRSHEDARDGTSDFGSGELGSTHERQIRARVHGRQETGLQVDLREIERADTADRAIPEGQLRDDALVERRSRADDEDTTP